MIYISYPKVNVFFKIIGFLDNGYCDVLSRYVLVRDSFLDVIEISHAPSFSIKGNFKCAMEYNTIFKAKEVLKLYLDENPKAKLLESFSIDVDKQIPIFAGLGGGSSNAASYLLAMNEILELGLGYDELTQIASNVGADVSFFLYDYASANVSGIGDVVTKYADDELNLEIIYPQILCRTSEVFKEFKRDYTFQVNLAKEMLDLKSHTLLEKFDIATLNDLYEPATRLYPELMELARDGYFFSGSGSSFFRLRDSNERGSDK